MRSRSGGCDGPELIANRVRPSEPRASPFKADFNPNTVNGVTATVSYRNGEKMAAFLAPARDRIRVLDFGAGGNPGRTGQALIDAGFRVTSYEPYLAESATQVEGKFDFIYAIEVFEHCHDTAGTAAFIAEHLADRGVWI